MRTVLLMAMVFCIGYCATAEGNTNMVQQTNQVPQLSATHAVDELTTCNDFKKLDQLLQEWSAWPEATKQTLFPALSEQLGSLRELTLTNMEDVAVMGRVKTGKMKWHMHGLMVQQDIFTVGGRAAWALEHLLKTELPSIEAGLGQDELLKRVKTIKDKIKQKP